MDWTHLVALAAGAAGGFAPKLIDLLRAKADISRGVKKDEIDAWQEIVSRNETDITSLKAELKTLTAENRACEARAAEMAAEVRILKFQVDRLEKLQSIPAQPTAPSPVTVITTTQPQPPAK